MNTSNNTRPLIRNKARAGNSAAASGNSRPPRRGRVTSVRLPEHISEALDLHIRTTMVPRSAFVRHHLDVLVASAVVRDPLSPRYGTKLSQQTTPVSIPTREFHAYKRAARALGYPSLSSMVIASLEGALSHLTGGAS